MTTSPSYNRWDLDRITQLVSENDLERGRIEYKRQLNDGRKTLEAIAALANTFGGVVLIGVDETQRGQDRLVGVPGSERARLVSWCWSRLTPPFNPEIIPVSLGHDDLFVFVVIVEVDNIRRPVMINQGNKVLVRLEGENEPPDWYRLRDLFNEQASSYDDADLPPADLNIYGRTDQSRESADVDLLVRGRLLLKGPRGRVARISGATHASTLAVLPRVDTPITGAGSALVDLMSQMVSGQFGVNGWRLDGRASGREFGARWQGLADNSRVLVEARLGVTVTPGHGSRDGLLIRLDALLTDPRRATTYEIFASVADLPEPDLDALARAAEYTPTPIIGLAALRKLMMNILGSLWGPVGEALSIGVLGQPAGPPAKADVTI